MKALIWLFLTLAVIGITAASAPAGPRIKDLVDVEGVRGNDLVGYGLVVGLDGSGDGVRNSPFTEDSLANLLERLGVNIAGEGLRPRNVAAVIVTAVLPPFARTGSRIDVTVSAIGDARSLLGGTLVMTPLNAADGEIYAVAQGSVLATGIDAEGVAAAASIGVPTVATIPGGARVEREVGFVFDSMHVIRLALRDPDFTTALRIEAAINKALGPDVARMADPATIVLDTDIAGLAGSRLIGAIENLKVSPSQPARVVVDQRTGTIVLGSDVRVSRVAVAQGNLTIRVTETPVVAQPNPFAEGETVVVPRTDIEIDTDPDKRLAVIEPNVTLSDLVEGLNMLGVGPRDMIDILKTIEAAGALHADLIVQ